MTRTCKTAPTLRNTLAALLGGALIGLAAFWNFVLDGLVTGVSSDIQNALHLYMPSVFFCLAFPIFGFLLSRTSLSPFPGRAAVSATLRADPLRAMSTVRLLTAAFLIGFGAAVSNGCTSGHGVCGLARMSPRSLTAVVVFMSCAAITATFCKSSSVIPPSSPRPVTHPVFTRAACVAVALTAVAPGLFAAVFQSTGSTTARALGHGSRGALFATGLMVSGMAHPGNTLRFLDTATPGWSPMLAAVFATAVPVSHAGYRWVSTQNRSPLLQPAFSGRTLTKGRDDVDARLVTGAAIFGAGWGISGVCPGPALTYAGAVKSPTGLIVTAAIAAGGYTGTRVTQWLSPKRAAMRGEKEEESEDSASVATKSGKTESSKQSQHHPFGAQHHCCM